MSFRRNALKFAEDLVWMVLRHYSLTVYKSASDSYRLQCRPNTSGSAYSDVEKKFRPVVGRAVVVLQLQHLVSLQLQDDDETVGELAPLNFDPINFLKFCALETTKMAHGYYSKANLTLPDYTTIAIARLLISYHDNGSFTEESWDSLYKSSRSVMGLVAIVDRSEEFVPQQEDPIRHQQEDLIQNRLKDSVQHQQEDPVQYVPETVYNCVMWYPYWNWNHVCQSIPWFYGLVKVNQM